MTEVEALGRLGIGLAMLGAGAMVLGLLLWSLLAVRAGWPTWLVVVTNAFVGAFTGSGVVLLATIG